MSKTYPSTVLQDRLRDAGVDCRCMWEIPGPKDTAIAWLSCYLVGKGVVIVQTFKDGNGWDSYTSCGKNSIEASVADVMERTGALLPA